MNKKVELRAAQRLQQFVGAMANLNPEDTGLDNIVVFINKKEGMRHGCRVKVSNVKGKYSSDNFSITMQGKVVGDPVYSDSEVNRIKEWMELNKEVILKYWNDPTYSIVGVARDIRKL